MSDGIHVTLSQVRNRLAMQRVAILNNGEYVTTVSRQMFTLMGHGNYAYVRHANRWHPLYRDQYGNLFIERQNTARESND